MREFYISFGQSHIHKTNNVVIDKDMIVIIQAETMYLANLKAKKLFGEKYADIYGIEPDMTYYPRGVLTI